MVKLTGLFILILLILGIFFFVQSGASDNFDKKIKLAPVQKNGKWGYIDKTGNYIIESQFDEARAFRNGLAGVKLNNKWGVIDKTGKFIVQPHFEIIHEFYEGASAVKINGKWGFIKNNGNFIVKPQFDDYDGKVIPEKAIRENCFFINGKRGCLDQDGNFVEFNDESPLVEGLIESIIDGSEGYIDNTGRLLVKNNKKYISIDKMRVFAMQEPGTFKSLCEGLALVQINSNYGYIDKTGKIIIKPQFEAACQFREGLAAAKSDGKWGYIDKNGEFAIEPKFELAEPPRVFREGLAAIKFEDTKKWGCINKSGNIVIEPKFDEMFNFSGGLARIKIDNFYGAIDKTGDFVIHPHFEEMDIFSEGITKVRINDKYGYIDTTGAMVAEPLFHWLSLRFKEGKALVKIIEGGKYSFIDKKGIFITGQTFDLARSFSNGMAIVGNQQTLSGDDAAGDKKWIFSFIDESGELIMPFQFESVLDFN